jgi:uncharacterized protein (TIGR00297 family)
VLLAFFLPSVGLSRLGKRRKRELVDIGKGGARDALQVLANGGMATACAVLFALSRDPRWAWAFAGAYAAATADTWATEIGAAFGGTPHSIVGFRPVATGLSGGVTALGSAAMVAGSAWIALVWAWPQHSWTAFAIVAAAGIAGELTDSVLGATLQCLRFCPQCVRAAETEVHVCGTPTVAIRGLSWMTNDTVNIVATAVGALVAGTFFALFVSA